MLQSLEGSNVTLYEPPEVQSAASLRRQDMRWDVVFQAELWVARIEQLPLLPPDEFKGARLFLAMTALNVQKGNISSLSQLLICSCHRSGTCPEYRDMPASSGKILAVHLCRTLPSCARIVCSAASDGRKKAARQRKEATDSAQQGVDKVADVIKSRAEKAEDALPSSTMGGTFRADAGSASAAPKQGIDDIADVIKSRADKAEGALPSSTTGGTFRPDASPSASTKQGVDDTADTLKVGAGQAQDAVNNPRGAVGDAARSTRGNVDDAADSEHLSKPAKLTLTDVMPEH